VRKKEAKGERLRAKGKSAAAEAIADKEGKR